MKCISCKKIRIIIIVLVVLVCLAFALKLVSDNRIMFAGLSKVNTTVATEQLDEDIDTILALYGLKKDDGEILCGVGNSIHDTYYKKADSEGKSVFVSVSPILFGSSREYTEIKTLIEMWLYVVDRDFEYEIDGITYYFTAPTLKSSLALLKANEIYMSKDEFMLLYSELENDGMKHKEKVEVLADAYVEKYGYKRGPGHIQVK